MTGNIFIYGGIGTEQGEVSIANVRAQLDPKATNYILHIISNGGDVFEGYGIYNILKNTNKPITTHVEGLCASIATLIAFAGDKIIMNKTSEFMIHNPSITDLRGDSRDIRNVADQLDKIKTLLIDVSGRRAARNGKAISNEKLWALYDNETWLTADQTIELGFVDEVQDAIKAVAKINQLNFNKKMEGSNFKKMFSLFTNLLKAAKIKNQVTDTLEDGRVIVVMTEDGEWKGKQVMLETGEPLPAGDYTLASGKTITVDENFTITTVADAAPANDTQEMEKDAKIKQLEEELAAAKAASQTASAAVTTAKQDNVKFQARLEMLEKSYKDLEEAAGKTAGDTTPVKVDHSFKNGTDRNPDPMGEEVLQFYKGRNII